MKKIIKRLLIVSSCFMLSTTTLPFTAVFTFPAEAHSGRTDSSGGHHDYKNKSGLGSYHYHHGYSAHLHPNGVCPYSSNSTSTTSSTPVEPQSSDTVTKELMDSYSLVFNSDYYSTYSDLQSSIRNDPLKLFQHFYTFGMAEGRKGCADFDVKNYKDNNSDLQNAYGDDLKAYYEHYRACGYQENRVH